MTDHRRGVLVLLALLSLVVPRCIWAATCTSDCSQTSCTAACDETSIRQAFEASKLCSNRYIQLDCIEGTVITMTNTSSTGACPGTNNSGNALCLRNSGNVFDGSGAIFKLSTTASGPCCAVNDDPGSPDIPSGYPTACLGRQQAVVRIEGASNTVKNLEYHY